MTRRAFLTAVLGFFFFPLKAVSHSRPGMNDEFILRSLLDALIPSGDTPGAKEAGLYEKLIALISEDGGKKRTYKAGLSMVRKEIEKSQGTTVVWDAIVEGISGSPFFQELRGDALRLFYAEPAGWKVAGYRGPPLVGYSEYHRCG